MTKMTKRMKPRQPQKNRAAVYRFEPLSPLRAFKAIVSQAERLNATAFVYSDGIATYSLTVGEAMVRLECGVGGVRIYSHCYQLATLRPEYARQVLALLTTPVGGRITATPTAKAPVRTETVAKLKLGSETDKDRAAMQNFRQSRRGQVHVASRKQCSDMAFGRSPGHIGDLK